MPESTTHGAGADQHGHHRHAEDARLLGAPGSIGSAPRARVSAPPSTMSPAAPASTMTSPGRASAVPTAALQSPASPHAAAPTPSASTQSRTPPKNPVRWTTRSPAPAGSGRPAASAAQRSQASSPQPPASHRVLAVRCHPRKPSGRGSGPRRPPGRARPSARRRAESPLPASRPGRAGRTADKRAALRALAPQLTAAAGGSRSRRPRGGGGRPACRGCSGRGCARWPG